MTPRDFTDTLRQAGITPDKPLHAILTTIHEASETAHAAATDGARGLTPDGEAALVAKLTSEVARAAESEVARLVVRSDFRRACQLAALGVMLLVAGYGVGRWDGGRQGAAAIEGAAFIAQIAGLNDLRLMAQRCRETQRPAQGGTACELPLVWVKR